MCVLGRLCCRSEEGDKAGIASFTLHAAIEVLASSFLQAFSSFQLGRACVVVAGGQVRQFSQGRCEVAFVAFTLAEMVLFWLPLFDAPKVYWPNLLATKPRGPSGARFVRWLPMTSIPLSLPVRNERGESRREGRP